MYIYQRSNNSNESNGFTYNHHHTTLSLKLNTTTQ
jgi:hypothetical protein